MKAGQGLTPPESGTPSQPQLPRPDPGGPGNDATSHSKLIAVQFSSRSFQSLLGHLICEGQALRPC